MRYTNILSEKSSLLEALQLLNTESTHGRAMTLFVCDESGRVSGTLTDGDIRRALISGLTTESMAQQACNRHFKAIRTADEDRCVELLMECRRDGIQLVPRLDADGRIMEIVDLRVTHNRLPVRAVLMAGGKGERLRPMTLSRPKPLLQIEGKAIIDYNIEALAAAGVKDITVCTRYLAEQIEEHFSVPVCGVKVKCIREVNPLGTIGALSLLSTPSDGITTLVMNSDLLTSISYEDMYLEHKRRDAAVTIAAVPYQVSVPFAILETDEKHPELVTGLTEKPSYSYYANAGIYMLESRVINCMEENVRVDAPELIEEEIKRGGRVTYFPIRGTWLDVGTPTDFRQACELMRHHRNLGQY
ncbi:MAG: NTP transferase domain-containing protein [Muribaculaceae bacterium]|nr:NTP transferase domain-containing protein [Muribaculaceae bacterium]